MSNLFPEAMNGADLIAAARQIRRQAMPAPGHDAKFRRFELSVAATCYTRAAFDQDYDPTGDGNWPDMVGDFEKGLSSIEYLMLAGAMIAAEIDRLRATDIIQN